MNPIYRAAVIEVGGRAVRLLVADVVSESRLRNVFTASTEVDLVGAVDLGGAAAETAIRDVIEVIRRYRIRAEEFRPTRIAAFGTEAIRRLGPVPVEGFRTVLPSFRALSKKEEAELSFLAGVLGAVDPANRFSTFLVIDQGSGSMEVVVGSLNAEGAKISAYKSYALGTRELVKMLQAAGTFDQLRKSLVVRFSRLKPFTHKVGGPPVVLGSAATRLAWMSVRPDPLASYDPRQVQGRRMRLSYIDSLIQVAERYPDTARLALQPQNPNGAEFETVLAGLVALEAFLKRECKEEFIVCGDGTRYGLAWRLALQDGVRLLSEL